MCERPPHQASALQLSMHSSWRSVMHAQDGSWQVYFYSRGRSLEICHGVCVQGKKEKKRREKKGKNVVHVLPDAEPAHEEEPESSNQPQSYAEVCSQTLSRPSLFVQLKLVAQHMHIPLKLPCDKKLCSLHSCLVNDWHVCCSTLWLRMTQHLVRRSTARTFPASPPLQQPAHHGQSWHLHLRSHLQDPLQMASLPGRPSCASNLVRDLLIASSVLS